MVANRDFQFQTVEPETKKPAQHKVALALGDSEKLRIAAAVVSSAVVAAVVSSVPVPMTVRGRDVMNGQIGSKGRGLGNRLDPDTEFQIIQ